MSTHPDPHSFDPAADKAVEVDSETSLPQNLPLTPRGWTPRRQAVFLRELASTHNVSVAAQAVGMSRQSAYKLRARLHGQPFDLAWQAAFQLRFDILAETAMQRAMEGTEVPHFHKGELIHTSRRFDERLTLGLLALRNKVRRPAPYSYEPACAYRQNDVTGLIARVEHGPELWRDEVQEEYDAKDALTMPEGDEENEFLSEVVHYDHEYGDGTSE